MPGRTQLSAEAIRHIATGEIGIRAAKTKYGIGEHRVRCIRQGLEVPTEDEDIATILREDHTQTEDDADRLRAEVDRLRAEHEENTNRILELEAEYDDLAELQHKTMRKLAEHKAQKEQQNEDNAAILREAQEAIEQAEKAQAEAMQALQRIATLESQNEQLRESLAEAQSAHLVLSEQRENRPTTQATQKSKKHARGRKK